MLVAAFTSNHIDSPQPGTLFMPIAGKGMP
jgi:hypothetical protein